MSFVQKFQYYSKRKAFKYGVPFLVMMVGGSFALKEFTQLRWGIFIQVENPNENFSQFPSSYQYSKKVFVKPEELEKIGVQMKESKEVTLETEYEKVKQIDIEHWENVRGERLSCFCRQPTTRLNSNLSFQVHVLGKSSQTKCEFLSW